MQRVEEEMVCTMSDLEACYDRQLLNIGGTLEESAWVNKEEIIIFTKVLISFEHHTGKYHGVGEEIYVG